MNTLLKRAKEEMTPLIDGNTLTFVYKGKTAPYIKGDFTNWVPTELDKIEDGIWTYVAEDIDSNAYIEYCYLTDPTDDDTRIADPFNPRKTTNGYDSFNQNVEMPESVHTAMTRYGFGVNKGRVSRFLVERDHILVGGARDVWLYQPPVDEPVPLLVCYDGKDYYTRGKVTVIVDNLIAKDLIQPIAIAFIENAGKARHLEYNQSETLLYYVINELIPLATQYLNLIDIDDNPSAYAVMGASMSGLMALHTGLRVPHVFGKVLTQSGAFFDETYTGFPSLIRYWVETLPVADIKIWQDVGKYDFLLAWNRTMRDLLVEKGYNLTYHEYPAGHNYTGWRDSLPDALIKLFGK